MLRFVTASWNSSGELSVRRSPLSTDEYVVTDGADVIASFRVRKHAVTYAKTLKDGRVWRNPDSLPYTEESLDRDY